MRLNSRPVGSMSAVAALPVELQFVSKASKTLRIRCNQCEIARINGVICHETGCQNTNARYDADSGEWIKQYECRECGNMVDAGSECCNGEEN